MHYIQVSKIKNTYRQTQPLVPELRTTLSGPWLGREDVNLVPGTGLWAAFLYEQLTILSYSTGFK